MSKSKKDKQTLSEQNAKLRDDVVDLKCRSMRDNLLFFGIPEVIAPVQVDDSGNHGQMEHSDEHGLQAQGAAQGPAPDSSGIHSHFQRSEPLSSYADTVKKEENCEDKVYPFCENVLKIKDARPRIKIDRAHA